MPSRLAKLVTSTVRMTQNQNSFPGTGGNVAEVFQGNANDESILSSGNTTTVVQENSGNTSRNEQIGNENLTTISL